MKSNHFRLWGVLFSALMLGLQYLPLQAQDAASVAYNNGQAAFEKGDLDTAIADTSQAIALEPNVPLGYESRGFMREMKGDLDGAIAEFREALRLDPNYGPAHFNLGLTLLRDSKTKAGREMIGKHWENVVAEFGEATRLQPNNDVAHYELGWVLEMRGERDRAFNEYRIAYTLKPDNATYEKAYKDFKKRNRTVIPIPIP